jgi:mono/diheme cytochrome c family protein
MDGASLRSISLFTAIGIFVAAIVVGTGSQQTTGATATITTNLSGQQLYTLACASCHGLTGSGRAFTLDGQTIKVPSLGYGRLSKVYSKNFDDQVRGTIVKGLDEEGKALNPMMPRWMSLSPVDVSKIIDYLKTLK